MKKSLPQIQYSRLHALYAKLSARLNKQFTTGRFSALSKVQQVKLLQRIERIKAQLHRLSLGLKLSGTALALGVVLYSGNAQAQFAKSGAEFLVNTQTVLSQKSSSVAMDSDGDFVVTWESYTAGAAKYDIYAQRYNAAGIAQGLEFLVNTETSDGQRDPSVAMDSDGDFVITWHSNYQDGDRYGIYAQRYNASGVAQGSEFIVNTVTTERQISPSIAMESNGDFVVTWSSQFQDGDDWGIYAQRYNASGIAQGAEFKVNTETSEIQYGSSIAMDSDGDFVITWQSYYQDGDYSGIYAQRYNASGAVQGGEFKVNTETSSYQYSPSVAMDSDGDFVITWESKYQDGDNYGIYAQRYNASGIAQGVEFLVNSYTTNDQQLSSLAMDSDGDFVVTWQSRHQDGDVWGIYAQRYNASGVKQGSEFLVNTYTPSIQRYSSVAMDSDGDFVVTWNSNGQDTYNYGVFGQRYTGGFTTAIQTSAETAGAELYPNPAKSRVFVNLEGEVTVRVLDVSGLLLKEVTLENKSFSVEGLKTGLYMIQLTKDGASAMKKLVVE